MNSVPKLRREWDWIEWSRKLREIFNHINGNYWMILSGQKPRPAEPTYTEYTQKQAKSAIARQNHLSQDQVTQRQIATFIEENNNTNARLRQMRRIAEELWEEQNGSALLLLRSTIGPDAQSAITGINSLREAYLKLLSIYGKVWKNVVLQYSKWTSVRFTQGMTAQSFVSKFQMTLQELQMVVSSPIQPLVQFLQFIEAIRGNPGVYRFLVTVTVDGYDENMMNNAYAHFLYCSPY